MQAITLDGKALAELDEAAWNRLAAVALTENPFNSRAHLLAGLGTVDRDNATQALAIHRDDGGLVGLFPFRRRRILPLPWSVAESATNLYQFSGLPLVDPAHAEPALEAWLEAMRTGPDLPRFWSLADADLGSPLVGMIERDCARRGLEVHTIGGYARPYLTRNPRGFDDHISSTVPKRRRRDIQRNLRRLQEAGTLVFERTDDPEPVGRRLEDFLLMEHAGWKGRAGTSFLSSRSAAAFARAAYRDAIIDTLLLDDRPIAISINISSGRTCFTPKCTYDEDWRRCAPGVVLEYLAMREFYADQRFDAVDATTIAEGHLVSELWNGSKAMGRLVIGPAGLGTRMLARTWESGSSLYAEAKRLLATVGARRAVVRLRGWPGEVLGSLRGRFAGLLHRRAGRVAVPPRQHHTVGARRWRRPDSRWS